MIYFNLKSKTRDTLVVTALAVVVASLIFLWRDKLSNIVSPSPTEKPKVLTTVLDKNQLPQYFSPQFPLPQDAKGVDSRVVQDDKEARIIYQYSTKSTVEEGVSLYKNFFANDPWKPNLEESSGSDGAKILLVTPTLKTEAPFLITLTLTFAPINNTGGISVLAVMTIPNVSDYSIGTAGPLSIPWNRR